MGLAPAVKEKGGVLVKVLRELHVEAEPAKLPHAIVIDIAPLTDFGSQILAKDLILPGGVSLLEKPEEVVASVYEPKEEKVEEVQASDLSQIEVVKKGKEPKEGEEGVAAEATGDKAVEKPAGKRKEEKK